MCRCAVNDVTSFMRKSIDTDAITHCYTKYHSALGNPKLYFFFRISERLNICTFGVVFNDFN